MAEDTILLSAIPAQILHPAHEKTLAIHCLEGVINSEVSLEPVMREENLESMMPTELETKSSMEVADVNSMSAAKAFLIWLSIALVNLCVFLDEGIIATAIPQITDEFSSLSDVGWYGSAYQLTLCSMQMMFGRLFAAFPIKSVFLVSVVIFEIGTIVCASAPSSLIFIVGRTIAGWGAAGISSGGFIITSAVLPKEKLPFYMGALGMIYGIGATLGPVLGGIITESPLTWRWCFWINLPIAGPAIVATHFSIRIPAKPDQAQTTVLRKIRSLDLFGMSLLLPCVISFILALQFGGSQGSWSDKRTIVCFVVSGALLVIFTIHQNFMGETALVPLRLLKNRLIIFGSLFAFCCDGGFFTLAYYIPLWFQAIQGNTPEISGLRLLSMMLPLIVSVVFVGAAVTKLRYFQPFMLAGGILQAIGAGVLSTLTPTSNTGLWAPFLMLAGIGIGLGTQQPLVAVQSILGDSEGAIALSIVVFAWCLGPTVMITVADAILTSVLTDGIKSHFPNIDPTAVRNSGATQLKAMVPPEDVNELLHIYNNALTRTYVLAAALATASALCVLGLPWLKIPQGIDVKEGEAAIASKGLDIPKRK